VGLVLICLGVGFLVSAAATHRLSKKWGLLDKPGDKRPDADGALPDANAIW
jgi:hypothetical protein